jgi:superfamily II DNA helicase RecQ
MVEFKIFPINLRILLIGITIVVSPLISLVEDQVYALRNLNIDARSLNTSTPRKEQTEIMHILDGKIKGDSTLKILYLTPGMFSNSERVN